MIWIEAGVKILSDGAFEGIVLDVTDGMRAEQALRESEKKYRDLTPVSVNHALCSWLKGHSMLMPAAISQQGKIETAVRAVEATLRPDVIHIRHEIEEDWSGQWAIFFRVVLSDSAAKNRLREVAKNVEWRLAERLDFGALGVYPYHNVRSESEQAALRDEAWA